MIGLILKGAWAWILKNPAVIGLSIALAAATIVIIGKSSDVAFYKAQSAERGRRVESLNQRIGILVANNGALTASIKRQSDSIDALAQASAASDAKFEASFAKLMEGRAQTNAAVKSLLARPTPADACAGAFDLVKELTK